jgi:hypothetical protein
VAVRQSGGAPVDVLLEARAYLATSAAREARVEHQTLLVVPLEEGSTRSSPPRARARHADARRAMAPA